MKEPDHFAETVSQTFPSCFLLFCWRRAVLFRINKRPGGKYLLNILKGPSDGERVYRRAPSESEIRLRSWKLAPRFFTLPR